LLIKGAPEGSERVTVKDLARRLQLGQSSVTELIQRAEEAGFLRRTPDSDDARRSWLSLTPEAEQRLAAVVTRLGPEHDRLAEILRSLGPDRAPP